MTAAELKHRGRAGLFRSFYPQGDLYNFDAEDRSQLAHLGTTDKGEDIEISKRAAGVRPAGLREREPRRDGRRAPSRSASGWRRTTPCATTTTPRRWCTRGRSWTTSTRRCTTPARGGWADHQDTVKVFQIETTLDNDVFRSRSTSSRSASGGGRCATRPRCSASAGVCGRAAEDAAQDVPRHAVGLRADRRERGRVEAVHERTLEGAPAAPRRGAGGSPTCS